MIPNTFLIRFIIVKLDEDSKHVMLQGVKVQKVVVRHLNDVKDFHGSLDSDDDQTKFMCDAQQSEVEKAALDDHADDSLADSFVVQVPRTSLGIRTRLEVQPGIRQQHKDTLKTASLPVSAGTTYLL